MPRFHLHIYNGGGVSCDDEGLDLRDLEAARAAAIDGIRSLASEEVRTGRLDLAGRVEIADPSGKILDIVRFADAVDVSPAEEKR